MLLIRFDTVKKPSVGALGFHIIWKSERFERDFPTVDLREELCYHSRPEKANSEILVNIA